ncbi:MAG: hypothetical protein R3344_08140 [Acidobacteriota bacterium]|nr:hypothetical protein [Acidobacteriota bacterium]
MQNRRRLRRGLSCRASNPLREAPIRRLATFAAFLFIVIIPASGAHAQIGVRGGFNRDSFGEFSDEEYELVDEVDGFHTGIFLDFSFGLFGVRPSIVYHRLTKAVIGDEDAPQGDIEIVEFPIEGRVAASFGNLRPYLIAGPTVMFPSSPITPVDDALAGTVVQLSVGIGVEWDVGFRVWPEMRIGSSIGGLVEDDPEGDSRLTTFMMRIGLSF